MTYRELFESLSEEQKDMDVTLQVNDEFYSAQVMHSDSRDNDILDDGHPYLIIWEDDVELKAKT